MSKTMLMKQITNQQQFRFYWQSLYILLLLYHHGGQNHSVRPPWKRKWSSVRWLVLGPDLSYYVEIWKGTVKRRKKVMAFKVGWLLIRGLHYCAHDHVHTHTHAHIYATVVQFKLGWIRMCVCVFTGAPECNTCCSQVVFRTSHTQWGPSS